jgi:hypothetical protein
VDIMTTTLPKHISDIIDNIASDTGMPISTKTYGDIVHVLAESRETDRYCAVFDDPYIALIAARQDAKNSVFVHSMAGPDKGVNSFTMDDTEDFSNFMKKYFMKLFLIRES